MASRGLGTLTLDLIAKIGGFEQSMDKAARHADKRMREIERRSQAFGNAIGKSLRAAAGQLLAFTGVTVGVAAGVDAIKSAIDRADNIRDLSIRLGVGTETLSKFGYAATQTGTDIEALNKGLLRLSKNATAALDPKSRQSSLFEALGISKDQLQDLDTLVPAIADKFAGMADGVQKAALAQELFGKSGAQLIEFLNQGSAGLKEMGDRAAELGIVIDQDTADAADRFNDTLADLKAATGGLAQQVAAALLPQLQELLDWAIQFTSDGENATEIADGIAEAFRGIVTAGQAIGSVIDVLGGVRTVLAGLENQAGAAGAALKAALTFDGQGLKDALKRYKEASAQVQAGFEGRDYNSRVGSMFQNVQGGSSAPAKPKFTGIYGGSASTEADFNPQAGLDKFFATGGRKPKSGGGGKKGENEAAKALREQARQAKEAREELERLVEQEAKARESFEAMAASLAGPLADANYQYIQDQKQLNELAKTGAIGADELRVAQENLTKAHEKNVEAINAQLTPAQEVIAGLQEELALLAMTNEQQELYNALKYAGADATAAEAASITQLTGELQKAREARAAVDDLKNSLKDLIVDATDGAGTAREAWDNFFDSIKRRAWEFVADKAVNALFDMLSGKGGSGSTGVMNPITGAMVSGGGGSSGAGFWASLLGAFIGGGKAGGGTVMPGGLYPVNERGTEMLSIGGRDYLMMGSQPGRVTPNHQLSAAGNSYGPTTIIVQGAPDRRTISQIDRANGRRARREMARSGA